jgi:hypothetical protein
MATVTEQGMNVLACLQMLRAMRLSLHQNTKAETCTNKERRYVKRTYLTLHHVLQRNRRHAQMRVAHFTI